MQTRVYEKSQHQAANKKSADQTAWMRRAGPHQSRLQRHKAGFSMIFSTAKCDKMDQNQLIQSILKLLKNIFNKDTNILY